MIYTIVLDYFLFPARQLCLTLSFVKMMCATRSGSPFQYDRKLPQAIFYLFFYLLSIIFYLEIKMPVKDVHPLQTFLFLFVPTLCYAKCCNSLQGCCPCFARASLLSQGSSGTLRLRRYPGTVMEYSQTPKSYYYNTSLSE